MADKFALTYYSDTLCLWAYISQARVDEVAERFSDRVSIAYRFCSVFGYTAHKIGKCWDQRGKLVLIQSKKPASTQRYDRD